MIFLPSAKFLYRPQLSVAPWTPLSLTTALYGWYKGDAGISVTTDGASITTWADQSGNTRDLTQSTAARRPTFRTSANGVNGKPVVEFAPGTTDAQQLVNTTFDGNASTGFSFYIVYQATSLAVDGGNRFGLGSSSRSAGSLYYQSGAFGVPQSMELVISLTGQWTLGAYGTQFQVAKLSRATTLAATKFKATYGSEGLTSVPNNSLPAGFFLGGSNDTSAGTKIAEVVVCNKELTPTEEASLDAYFRSRYGFGLYYGADLPITGAALWLDASRSDSLFVENTFATAVTTDNGPVGGWKDLSGNNRHALQSGTNRPTWRTPINGQNGLGVMSFNGSTQYFDVASLPSLASGYTFYGVIKQPTSTGAVLSSASAGVDGSTAAMIARLPVTAVGNAQVSTTNSKFGAGSALFDGSGDYLSVSASEGFNFGTGAFTIEMFFRIPAGASAAPSGKVLVSNENASWGEGAFTLYSLLSTTAFRPSLYVNDFSASTPILTPTSGDYRDNTWHHLAIVRQTGGAMNMYIDGTSVASAMYTGNCGSSTRNLLIGHNLVSGREHAGGVADCRFSKVARYTSAFTPSAVPLPDTAATDSNFAQTSLLLHMDGANGSTVFIDSSNSVGTGITQGGKSLAQAVASGTVVGVIGNYDGTHTAGNYLVRTSSSAANVSGVMTQTASTPATGTASIGRLTNATAYFNSQIYELVVLPRQSNSTEDAAWKTYTAAKWGITWS